MRSLMVNKSVSTRCNKWVVYGKTVTYSYTPSTWWFYLYFIFL